MGKKRKKLTHVARPMLRLVAARAATDDAHPGEQDPVFALAVDGLPIGSAVEIVLWEVKGRDDDQKADRELGRLKGTTSVVGVQQGYCSFDPDAPLPARDAVLGESQKNGGGETAKPPVLAAFEVATPGGVQRAYFRLDDSNAHDNEGDTWEVKATGSCEQTGDILSSAVVRVSRLRRRVPDDKATHPARVGNRIKLYADGYDDASFATGAFEDMVTSIEKAQLFIFAADWSFHPLFRPMRVGPFAEASAEGSIGALLIGKARTSVTVAVHTWDHTSVAAADDQNDSGKKIFEELAGGDLPASLHWRMSSRSGPVGYLASSHHQKMLVMDYPETDGRLGIRAFLGGLDLTKGRLDHHGHPVAPPPLANGLGDATTWAYAQKWSLGSRTVDEWYNAETDGDRGLPRQPWHDVHARLDGPAAWDYLREFVGRWLAADEKALRDQAILQGAATAAYGPPGLLLSRIDAGLRENNPLLAVYLSLLSRKDVIPMQEPLPDGKFCVQVCRSLEKSHWNAPVPDNVKKELPKENQWSTAYDFKWRLKESREQSILAAYYQGIDQAERFIYIENQYFIGYGAGWGGTSGAENEVPLRLVNKIKERKAANKEFHVYIVMPLFPEGDPGSAAMKELRACEAATIEYMMRALGEGWEHYLSFYFLANWGVVPPTSWLRPEALAGSRDKTWVRRQMLARHQRYMIYVHSKLMIVDDRYVILGSCNLNDRGLMGDGDSEICSSIWPMLKHQDACIKVVKDLRKRLWDEHFGSGIPSAWETPEKEACWSQARKQGFANYKAFREMTRNGAKGHICLLNFELRKGRIAVRGMDASLDVFAKIRSPEPNQSLPDAPYSSEEESGDEGWGWRGQFKMIVPRFLVE